MEIQNKWCQAGSLVSLLFNREFRAQWQTKLHMGIIGTNLNISVTLLKRNYILQSMVILYNSA